MIPPKLFAAYVVAATSYIGISEYKTRAARAKTEQKLKDYFSNM